MKSLKWIVVVALVFVSSINVNAQGKQQRNRQAPDSEQMAKRMEKMKTDLNLNEKQAEQFETLYAVHIKAVNATREKYAQDREKMRTEMDANRDAFEKDLAGILTAEQLAKYNELAKLKKEQPQGGQKGKGDKGAR